MIGLIHLPVTLIRLWGFQVDEPRLLSMLDSYMHMVKAIDTLNNYLISPDHCRSYDYHYREYLRTTMLLYPDFPMRPKFHMGLHMAHFLEEMGPVHAWRVPAFERYNFLMQQENTNQKIGQYVVRVRDQCF